MLKPTDRRVAGQEAKRLIHSEKRKNFSPDEKKNDERFNLQDAENGIWPFEAGDWSEVNFL